MYVYRYLLWGNLLRLPLALIDEAGKVDPPEMLEVIPTVIDGGRPLELVEAMLDVLGVDGVIELEETGGSGGAGVSLWGR